MFIKVTLRAKIYLLSIVASSFLLAVIIVAHSHFTLLSSTYSNYSEISELANRNLELSKDVESLKASVQSYTYTRYSDITDDIQRLYGQISNQLAKEQNLAHDNDQSVILMKKHLSKYFDTFLELKRKVTKRDQISADKKLLLSKIEHDLQLFFTNVSRIEDKLLESDITRSLYDAEAHALYFLDTLDNNYIKKCKKSLKLLKVQLKSLLDQTTGKTKAVVLSGIISEVDMYSTLLIQELQQTKGYLFLVNVVMAAESYEVLYQVESVTSQSQKRLNLIIKDAELTKKHALNILTATGISFFISLLIFSFLLSRSIVGPIRSITRALKTIERGDVNADIPDYVIDDDIGELTHSARSFLKLNIELAELLASRTELTNELTLSEERFSLALDGANDGLWDWNLLTDHVFYSSTWNRMFLNDDVNEGESFNTWKSHIHPSDLKGAIHDVQQYLKGETLDYHSEMRMMTHDGSYIHVLSKGKAIFDENGVATRMLGFHIDTSKQKQLEQSLHNAKKLADNANKAKSDFLANMSHEIRTPLNGIIGLTDLVLATNLKLEQENFLKKSQASSHALLRVINDILDYSKIEAGKLDLEEQNFELHKTVGDIRDLFEYQAQIKNISLDFELNISSPFNIIGDSLRVTQVLINLVGNALKFTSEGGVTIVVDVLDQSNETVLIQFTIKDSGIGMKTETVSKLFNEFSQADSSITREFGGTGLGLAISKQLVKLMHGEIWVESKEGVGSEFIFKIPFNKGGVVDSQAENSIDADDLCILQNINVLVAEDNLTNQIVINGILNNNGVNVTIANNGQEAVEKVQKIDYDIILMDLQMPVMDGFEATKEIRKLNRYKNVPIFALSAAVMQQDKELTTQAGMDEHLAKPIVAKKLFQAMIQYMKKARVNS